MPDLLFELGTEEMPALEIPRLGEGLRAGVEADLTAHGLTHGPIELYYTPRRIAIIVHDLAARQADRVEEVKGPPAAVAFDASGSPTQAAIGFAKAQGATVDDLETRQVGGKSYLYLRRTVPGRETVELLPGILSECVRRLRPSKSMRWDDSGLAFIRPIRWLVCLYGDAVVPVQLGHLTAGRTTRGHRFIASQSMEIQRASDYTTSLAAALVIVDPKEREETVIQALKEAAATRGGDYLIDSVLLSRIVNGAEHPVPVIGHVPEEFLDLPAEVVQATLHEEGKFVPFVLSDGTTPYFMGFRDGLPDEKGIVRAGFERVVRARLRDSRFFFEKDRARPLADRVRELRSVIYDVRLGSVWDKVERIRAIAGLIATAVGAPAAAVDRAAFLCKADLVTELVKAFPELEGTAGAIYARLDGEPEDVARAIGEHYLPRASDDPLPESPVGITIGLADKLDTIVGALLVGEAPKGSRDPYGIKRQANALVRIAVEKRVDLDFIALVGEIKDSYAAIEQKAELSDVIAFISDRAGQVLRQRYGIPPDVVQAVSAGGIGNFHRAYLRGKALADAKESEDFAALKLGFTRVRNITRSVARTDFDPSLFTNEAERALWREYLKAEGEISREIAAGDYSGALTRLLALKGPIDRYFDEVLVMDEDAAVRNNRLAFLNALSGLFLQIGDISLIAVENSN